MKKNNISKIALFVLYILFVSISIYFGFEPGEKIAENFLSFSYEMLKILPFAFVLIGLFEVWIKKETVEKHLGEKSNFMSFFWVILLAGTTIGGLYVAFPVAYSLYKKGAKLSIVFTYIGASGICRIPMAIFEASFLGVKFTLIRIAISIPLVIASSIILGNRLKRKNYKISNTNKQ